MSTTLFGIVDGRALGTSMRLIVTRPDGLAAARASVDRIVNAIDEAASRFRDDSELSRVNRDAGHEVRVSPLLAQAIAAGLRGARLTDGAVDPTVGSAVRLAGYDRDFATVPPDGKPINMSVTRVPGWQAIQFDDRARVVAVPPGVEIDLGATIATSSITVRRWTRGGVVLHHIIDPSTGMPVDGPWRTASVVAASCVDANIASTAAIVKGESAIAWLATTGLQARLVDRDGGVHRVSGWPNS